MAAECSELSEETDVRVGRVAQNGVSVPNNITEILESDSVR